MTKLEFLKIWLANQGYAEKAAVQSVISIQFEDADSSGAFKQIPWAVWVEDGVYKSHIEGSDVIIDGAVHRPLFVCDDYIDLPGDFHPVLRGKKTDTTFGLLLFNVILFWEVFGTKIPYVNEEFTPKLIQGYLSDLMVDNPKEGESVPEGKASVDDCMKFTRHCNFLEGLGTYFVRPGGVEMLTISPAILKRKDELIAKLKADGKFNDPVAVTKAIDELVKMDREEIMNGPGATFIINDGFISNARKRMFIAFGIEPKGDGWVFLDTALDQGMDPDEIVVYINTAIAGSYSRSKSTGEGGAQVKEVLKLVGRRKVDSIDCGTLVGEPIKMHDLTTHRWAGSYYIRNGKSELLTKEISVANAGKILIIRTPNGCRNGEGNYCAMCCGTGLGKLANRLSAEVVRIPTIFMLSRMKAQHVAGAKTVRMNLSTAIR